MKFKVGDIGRTHKTGNNISNYFFIIKKVPISIPQVYCIQNLATGQELKPYVDFVDDTSELVENISCRMVKLLYG